MCGRYALAMRPSRIRELLQNDDMPVDDAPADEGDGAPRQAYNFAPGYYGIVYRADVPDHGAGPASARRAHRQGQDEPKEEDDDSSPAAAEPGEKEVHYKLHTMKWGLVPSWTKRNPDYASVLKTINCRDDSLATPGGLWGGIKGRKRCVVIAEGFYEWITKGPKTKVPYYVKRKDGRVMCFAGLWDCVSYEDGEKVYTYTIVTTSSSERLRFLHDRMPVILEPGSEEMRMWLDPGRWEWDRELQGMLRPFAGELEVYAVDQGVGKVGNESRAFVRPVGSLENKGNIANFFAKGKEGKGKGEVEGGNLTESKEAEKEGVTKETGEDSQRGVKRDAEAVDDQESSQGQPPSKKVEVSPAKEKSRPKISATSNPARSPAKNKGMGAGSRKITSFFGKAG
ncbi:hypothetical protein QBC47DRAFT_330945 [Echria macrotheca]|uniref:DUF159-domain-containing protein n=1 Tax=Echria macrotheca TaxID=438768 RepID=A0AAJ0B3G6_9PEZI|nr:hypothetical protein QBC47DRAFT_330945 [Echria macrotheca]